jgi:hypothetical protein
MSRIVSCTLLAGLLVAAAPPARAWAPETRVRMADEAIRMMPESLRMALESYREPLLRGLLEPMVDEDGPGHEPPWADGTLDTQVETAAAKLIATLGRPAKFDEVAGRFGALAHYVLDAGFPPAAAGRDGAGRYAHFSAFCESRRERFPLVFYGHDEANLAQGDFQAFALAVLARARAEDLELARAYAAAGDPPRPSAFDDRSVPFAVGSLSYSHSVTDVVRVWLAAWRQAGGDMGRTPYFDKQTSAPVAEPARP